MQLQYSKGDTFKTEDGQIGLVLDSRISGVEFCCKYDGINVPYILTNQVYMAMVDRYWKYTVESRWSSPSIETFYYSVLIGDERGWMELEALE